MKKRLHSLHKNYRKKFRLWVSKAPPPGPDGEFWVLGSGPPERFFGRGGVPGSAGEDVDVFVSGFKSDPLGRRNHSRSLRCVPWPRAAVSMATEPRAAACARRDGGSAVERRRALRALPRCDVTAPSLQNRAEAAAPSLQCGAEAGAPCSTSLVEAAA